MKSGLLIAIAFVTMVAPSVARAADRITVDEVLIDETFDYPCLGEPVHVTAIIRIMAAFSTDANGGIHAQLFEGSSNADAIGLTSGTPYQYRSRFINVFNADSDSAPLVAHASSTIKFAQQGGGPTLELTDFFQAVINGQGDLVIIKGETVGICTP